MILFWNGAVQSKGSAIQFSTIASYYLLLIPIGIALTSHVEEGIAHDDIRQGELVKYLTKPFSYYWIKFYEEIPFRILQGIYGIVAVLCLAWFFPVIAVFVHDPVAIFLTTLIFFFAYLLSFSYKMIVGLIAFWLTDIGGFFQFQEMVSVILAGYLIPLSFLPSQVAMVAYFSPFAYMIYFPVLAAQGRLAVFELIHVVILQSLWLLGLWCLYMLLWTNGLKKFTAVGQ
jgi:ABC-2 type transport system permease protein